MAELAFAWSLFHYLAISLVFLLVPSWICNFMLHVFDHVMLLLVVAVKSYDPSYEHKRKQWWKVAQTSTRKVGKKQFLDDFGGCKVLCLLYEFWLSGHSMCACPFSMKTGQERKCKTSHPTNKCQCLGIVCLYSCWIIQEQNKASSKSQQQQQSHQSHASGDLRVQHCFVL